MTPHKASDEVRHHEARRIASVYEQRGEDRRYSWLEPGHQFLAQGQERAMLRLLGDLGFASLRDVRLLEVGCGTGNWLRRFVLWGATPSNLSGIDLLPDRISAARESTAPGVHLGIGDAAALNFPDGAFDIVFQSTMFTSILDARVRSSAALEMLRVLKPGGTIIWYDYFVPSPRNPDVRAIRLAELRELFPPCNVHARRVSLVPPIARALARRAWWVCETLELIPWLRTHYLASIQKC